MSGVFHEADVWAGGSSEAAVQFMTNMVGALLPYAMHVSRVPEDMPVRWIEPAKPNRAKPNEVHLLTNADDGATKIVVKRTYPIPGQNPDWLWRCSVTERYPDAFPQAYRAVSSMEATDDNDVKVRIRQYDRLDALVNEVAHDQTSESWRLNTVARLGIIMSRVTIQATQKQQAALQQYNITPDYFSLGKTSLEARRRIMLPILFGNRL